MICHFCKKVLSNKDYRHIYYCPSGKDITDNELKRFKFYEYNSGKIFEYEDIYHKYTEEEWSVLNIAKYLNISYSAASFVLKFLNIHQRTLREAVNTTKINFDKKASFKKIYGVENPSQADEIKNKKRITCLKNYGADNVRKSAWFKQYYKDTMQQKYGVGSLPNRYGKMQQWWDTQTDDFKKNHMKKAIAGWKKYWHSLSDIERQEIIIKRVKSGAPIGIGKSKLEERLSAILNVRHVSHVRQKWITNRCYDFLIDGSKLLIEVNGDFWHMNPDIYSEDDLAYTFKNTRITAKDVWTKDLYKKELAERKGYRVLYIWETDFKTLTDDELIQMIFVELLKS